MPSSPPGEPVDGREPIKPLRLALVVPRFGDRVSGGAELLGRWLAERLSQRGHAVDIFTTCALDHRTWRNELPPGVESHDGIRVHRFPATERDLGIHGELDRAIADGFKLSRDEELLWLRHGGSSEAMEEEISKRAGEYDAVLAMPYLLGTTYFAFAACPEKSVVIPCLHDEPFAYMGFVQEMLSGARGLLFNTNAEAELAQRVVHELPPWGVVGTGLEGAPADKPSHLDVPEPSLLYVGRREPGKNTPLLIDYFARYRSRRSRPLHLVFAGAGDPVPNSPEVMEITPDWSDPLSFYRAATILCQPSTNESLSIVLLQGWLAERPALVHGECAVTREHCERSNGGLWYTSYVEFEEVVDRLLDSSDLRIALGRSGRAYVEREYSWPAVLGRFDAAMSRILGTGRQADVGVGAR